MTRAIQADRRAHGLLDNDQDDRVVVDRNACVASGSPVSLGGFVLRKVDEIGSRLNG
jgi:hypothetical protein